MIETLRWFVISPFLRKPLLGTRALSGFDGIFVSSALSGSTPTQTHIFLKNRQTTKDGQNETA